MRFNSVIVAITALSLQGCNGCDGKKNLSTGSGSPSVPKSRTSSQDQLRPSQDVGQPGQHRPSHDVGGELPRDQPGQLRPSDVSDAAGGERPRDQPGLSAEAQAFIDAEVIAPLLEMAAEPTTTELVVREHQQRVAAVIRDRFALDEATRVSEEAERLFSDLTALVGYGNEVARMSKAVGHGVRLDDSPFDRAIARSRNHEIVDPFYPDDAAALLGTVEERIANLHLAALRPRFEAMTAELERSTARDERWRQIISFIETSDSQAVLYERLTDELDAQIIEAADRIVEIKSRALALRPTPDASIEAAAADLGQVLRIKDELMDWAVNDESVPDRLLLAGKNIYSQLERDHVIPSENVYSRLLEVAVGELQNIGETISLVSRLTEKLLNGDGSPRLQTGALRDAYTQIELIGASVHLFLDAIGDLQFARDREMLENLVPGGASKAFGIHDVPHLSAFRQRWEELLEERRRELGPGENADPAEVQRGIRENELVAALLALVSDPAITDEAVLEVRRRFPPMLRDAENISLFVQHRREVARFADAIWRGVDFRRSSFEVLVRQCRTDRSAPAISREAGDRLQRTLLTRRETPYTGTLIIRYDALIDEVRALIEEDAKWVEILEVIENSNTQDDLYRRLEQEHDVTALAAAGALIRIKEQVRALRLSPEQSIENAARDAGAALRTMTALETWVANPSVPHRLIQGGVNVYELLSNQKYWPAVRALGALIEAALPTLANESEATELFARIDQNLMGTGWRPGQPVRGRLMRANRAKLERVKQGVIWFITNTDRIRAASTRAELEEITRQDTHEVDELDAVPYLTTVRERWAMLRNQRLLELAN